MIHRSTYRDMLRHDSWRKKRQEILERDGHRCRNCGRTDQLQVHHRHYLRVRFTGHKVAPWCYPGKSLITLCESCHKVGHALYVIPTYTI